MSGSIAGPRIREKRRAMGITQAELARRVGVSASYLNLIERNRRRIAGALLQRVAEQLDLRLDQLDGANERRLMDRLAEIAAEPRLSAHTPEIDAVADLIGRYPGWAALIAGLGRSERAAAELAQTLSDRLTHDPFLGESIHAMLSRVAAIRSASEILNSFPDIEPDRRARFEAGIFEESQRLSAVAEALAAYFDKAHTAARAVTPGDEVEAMFETHANQFPGLEAAAEALSGRLPVDQPPEARRQAAEDMAREEVSDAIADIVANAPEVVTERAAARARVELLHYVVDAALAPAPAFREAAAEARYDVEAIADAMRIPVEAVFRRLTSLPRLPGVPRFSYLCVNAAGQPLMRREIDGLSLPRTGGACPLWSVFRVIGRPGETMRQVAELPAGERFVFAARARAQGRVGFGRPRDYVADMLAMNGADAALTVYGDGLDYETPEPVGVACRICPRDDCEHRAIDRLTGG